MDPLTAVPDRFMAGTTVKLLLTLDGFPATAGWTVRLALAGAAALAVNATASGANHALTLSTAQTTTLTPGLYKWSLQASLAGETYEAGSGTVTVAPNPAAALGGNQQEWYEQALTAVRAAIRGQLTSNLARFAILGRTVEHLSPEELRTTEAWLAAKVARRRPGARSMQRVGIRFTRPEA